MEPLREFLMSCLSLIILYFVNNILRNKKSSSFYDNGKDRGSFAETPSVLCGLLLYKQLYFIILDIIVKPRKLSVQ